MWQIQMIQILCSQLQNKLAEVLILVKGMDKRMHPKYWHTPSHTLKIHTHDTHTTRAHKQIETKQMLVKSTKKLVKDMKAHQKKQNNY